MHAYVHVLCAGGAFIRSPYSSFQPILAVAIAIGAVWLPSMDKGSADATPAETKPPVVVFEAGYFGDAPQPSATNTGASGTPGSSGSHDAGEGGSGCGTAVTVGGEDNCQPGRDGNNGGKDGKDGESHEP